MMRIPAKQRGFGLVGTIFIMVACAIIGVYMTSLGVSQSVSIGRSVEANRAYYAALAGVEWAISQVNNTAPAHDAICGTQPQTPPDGITTNFNLTEGALNGYQITITCNDWRPLYSDAAETITVPEGPGFTEGCSRYELDTIRVKAEIGGNPGDLDYVSRTIEGTILGRDRTNDPDPPVPKVCPP